MKRKTNYFIAATMVTGALAFNVILSSNVSINQNGNSLQFSSLKALAGCTTVYECDMLSTSMCSLTGTTSTGNLIPHEICD